MTEYKLQYQAKVQEFDELTEQFSIFQSQSNELISQLELSNAELKKKLESAAKQFTDFKEKRKQNVGSLEKQLEQSKKEKNQYKTKCIEKDRKVVELENIIETLQSENRASQYMLSEYQERVQKTMEQLTLLQISLEENKHDSEDVTTRLRNQLRQTQDQLYVVKLKHLKHNDESQTRLSTIKQSCIRPNLSRKDTRMSRVSFIPQQSSFVIKSDDSVRDKNNFSRLVQQLNKVIVKLEKEIREGISNQMGA